MLRMLGLIFLGMLGLVIYHSTSNTQGKATAPTLTERGNSVAVSEPPERAQAVGNAKPSVQGRSLVDLQRATQTAQNELEAEKIASLKRLADNKEYISLKASAEINRQLLEKARKSGTSEERLAASKAYNDVRLKFEKMEVGQVENDRYVALAMRKLTDAREAEQLEERRLNNARIAAEIEADAKAARIKATQVVITNPEVGSIGYLPPYRVFQVVDNNQAIVEPDGWGLKLWLVMPTGGTVDHAKYTLRETVKITGTKQYGTVLGASSQIFKAVIYTPE